MVLRKLGEENISIKLSNLRSKFNNLFSAFPLTVGFDNFGSSLFKKYSSWAIVLNFNFFFSLGLKLSKLQNKF